MFVARGALWGANDIQMMARRNRLQVCFEVLSIVNLLLFFFKKIECRNNNGISSTFITIK